MNIEVEFVARAFYDAEYDARCWDNEPDIIKEEFRRFAREAIDLLDQECAHRLQQKDFPISYAA